MGQPTRLRITLLLSVLLLAACTTTPSAPPTALPPTVAALPPPTVPAPTQSAAAPASLAATAAPMTPPSLAEQEIIADNRRTQHQQRVDTPQPPVWPIHPRLLRTLGLGGAVASALSPDGRFLAVGTTAGWGVYTLPNLRQVRFEEIVQGVRTLVWSANGRRLAVVSVKQTSIYRFPEGVLVSSRQGFAPPLIFSPDGKMIASIYMPARSGAESMGPPQPSYITFVRSDAGSPTDPLGSLETYGSVTFSPDNTLLATEGENDTLLWKRGASSAVLSSTLLLRVPGVHPVFSPNGRVLATTVVSNSAVSNSEMVVRLWRMPSGRPLAQFAIGPESAHSPPTIAFRDDGARLAILGGGQLQIWDAARGKLVRTQVVSDSTARLSPDARTLATYNDGSLSAEPGIDFIRMVDSHVLYQDKQAMFNGAMVWQDLMWSADGTVAAYLTSDGRIHVIDLARGTARVRAFPYYTNPAFSPDGQTLAAVQASEAVALWRIDDPAFARQLSLAESVSPYLYRTLDRVEFAPDGRSLVAQEYDTGEQSLRVATISWDLASDQPGRRVWELRQTDDDMPVKVIDTYLYSPAAHAAAWANKDGIQMQRDGGAVVTLAPASTGQVIDMAFSSNGRMLAASDNSGSIRLFSITPTTATLIQTLSVAQGYGLDGVVFSSDGTLFGLTDGGFGQIWRVGEPSPFVRFGFEGGDTGNAVDRLSIAPDNQLLIADRFKDIAFYRLSDGLKIGTLPFRGWALGTLLMPYESVVFSPAGDRLATTNDGRILIWDLSSR